MTQRDMVPRRRQEPAEREDEYPLDRWRRDIGSFFDRFWGAPFASEGEFTPQVDVTETDDQVKVSAELPGMDQDDIEVSLSRNVLTISGEKRQEREEEREGYVYAERSYGSFRRSVTLPASVQADQAEAVFNKGVLDITFPKTEEARSRKKIEVQGG